MKELWYGWIRDIAFYTLLMELILHVLPEKSHKKYLQFFMGLVLILLVVSPLLSFAGLDGKLDETYALQTGEAQLQDFVRRQEALEESREALIQQETEEEQVSQGISETDTRKGEEIEIHIEIGAMEED
jgi:stage III sporulation protein AF